MFWRIWVRCRHPSNRPFQNHPRAVAVTFDSDDVKAFAMTHMRHVDRRHWIVSQDRELKTIRAVLQRALCKQRGQRTFQSAQIESFHSLRFALTLFSSNLFSQGV